MSESRLSADRSLALIIPIFNESSCISDFYEMLSKLCWAEKLSEIIFVDDGSGDDSWNEILKLATINPRVKAIQHLQNQGLGGAIRSGCIASNSARVCWVPVDQQFDVGHILRSANDAEIVLFTRATQGQLRRDVITRIWQFIFRHAFGTSFRFQSGIFIMPRHVFLSYPLITSRGISLAELLVRIERGKNKFVSIPIDCRPRSRGDSKSFSIRSILRSVRELLGLFLIEPSLFLSRKSDS